MKNRFAIIYFLLFASSCSQPAHLDNSKLMIDPGIGIRNIIEIGMTPQQIAERTGDVTAKHLEFSGGWLFEIPSLGGTWSQEENTQPVSSIYFLVASTMINEIPANKSLSRFSGNVRGGLSFAKDGKVTHTDVMQKFGEPIHTISVPLVTEEHRDNMIEWAGKGESYAWHTQNTVALFYPKQGISFTIHSNVVVMINIFSSTPQRSHP